MSVSDGQRNVKCHHCDRTFPVAEIKDGDEAQQAVNTLKEGGSTVRVARWCPWCGQTNMVELPVELVENRIVFRDAGQTLPGLPPTNKENP